MYSLFFDGASKSNPGLAGCGCVIYDSKNIEVLTDKKYLGSCYSNNYAEYCGLLLGLKLAINNKIKEIRVHGDSSLVINQMSGVWKIKSANLIKLFDEAKELMKYFDDISFHYVQRKLNSRADHLANIVLLENKP